MGAEYRWWFLRFRGGASEGYPTFGLGLDIPLLKIDYAYYSRELGRLAGDIREQNHVISLALRFGSGATESRERIKKAKDASKIKGDAAVPEAEAVPAEAPKAEKKSRMKLDGNKKDAVPATEETKPEVPAQDQLPQ
jgi:hypothetical protein